MATLAECEQALRELSGIIGSTAGRDERSLRRSVSCRITDLDTRFVGELRDGALHDMRAVEPGAGRADIRITTTSDDLVELVSGSLGFGSAWASGRVKIDASLMDLLRLRRML
ncbi:MAG: SCP2 sterol-binding domain-containing protein [Geodermatophilaceae bacterium]|nr:SCP2 sterol-binding domain-containing protein [Geodermatophilaceae bacterium]MDQ3456914.1 SCP2 sterol-binding domain-containing protein [Actinomycetota bacterium]